MLTRTYRKWSSMIQRCTNPRHPAFAYYGGRGIKVCPRWRGRSTGFTNFQADLGEAPEGMWLDRIDNAGNYEPSNCKWSTPKEQAANRRAKTTNPNSIQQKAIRAGLPYSVVYQRLRWGWSEELALSTPKGAIGRLPGQLRGKVTWNSQP